MSYKNLDLTHAYVGTRPCGHVGFIGVDDNAKDLANEIAKLIRRGWTIDRRTIEEARQADIKFCDCAKIAPVQARRPAKSDRRQVERRADKRRQDDKTKARLKR